LEHESHGFHRHPLAYLTEAADDICYGIIDLEDAVELRIITFRQMEDILLRPFSKKRRKEIKDGFAPDEAFRVNLARLRGPVFDLAVSGAIEGFMKGYKRIMQGDFDGDVFSLLDADDPRKTLISETKQFAKHNIYHDQKKVEVELGSYSTFESLLEAFCTAALEQADKLDSSKGKVKLSWKSSLVLQLLGDHAPTKCNAPPKVNWSRYQCLRRAIDFVSGMTDNYATYIAKQLQGMAFSGLQRP
jgi:dGTPase